MLHDDLTKVRRAVDPMIKVPIDDNTRCHLFICLQCRPRAFSRSTMLRKLNAGDIAGACDEMKRWTFSGGKRWQGLINRRETEKAICHGTP
ncbi:glycoside hydrolase family protein [Morganella morganii]